MEGASTFYPSLVQINQITMIKINRPPEVHSKNNNNFKSTIRSRAAPMAIAKPIKVRLHHQYLLLPLYIILPLPWGKKNSPRLTPQ